MGASFVLQYKVNPHCSNMQFIAIYKPLISWLCAVSVSYMTLWSYWVLHNVKQSHILYLFLICITDKWAFTESTYTKETECMTCKIKSEPKSVRTCTVMETKKGNVLFWSLAAAELALNLFLIYDKEGGTI